MDQADWDTQVTVGFVGSKGRNSVVLDCKRNGVQSCGFTFEIDDAQEGTFVWTELEAK